MRILHINCNYIGTTLHQLMIEELDKIGYNNQVYVPTYNKRIAVIVPNENVIVSECFKKADRILFDYKQRKIYKDIQSKIHVSAFDCIHAYTLFTDGNCARKLSKKHNIPYVVAIRNTDVNDFFKKMIHLKSRAIKIMQDAKAIFFLSESYRKHVFEYYVPKKLYMELIRKTHIIPNGIDNFWFENKPHLRESYDFNKEIKLIYTGRIDKNKNIPTIQKAMKILQNEGYNVTLTVVGRIESYKEFKKVKSDRFTTYFPPMEKNKLIHLYRSSDIFVMPSFKESFGLVYAEAMSQGLPVIYTRGQGFDGQFNEGEVGYHASANNAETISEGVLKIIQHYSELNKRVVEKAKKFKWADIVRSYDVIYKGLDAHNK